MKKQISLVAAVLLTAGILFTTGCKKDDTAPPTITLTGSNPMTVSLGSSITDPGATASDEKDGAIAASSIKSDWSSTNPNVNMAGTYTIKYTASDAAGNEGSSTRTVNIVNDAAYLAGVYNADDSCAVSFVAPYTATITASTTVNKQFVIKNFGGFGSSTSVTATVSGTTVGSTFNWLAQQLDVSTNTLSAATAAGSVSSLSPVQFSFGYQWNDGTANELCNSTYVHQ